MKFYNTKSRIKIHMINSLGIAYNRHPCDSRLYELKCFVIEFSLLCACISPNFFCGIFRIIHLITIRNCIDTNVQLAVWFLVCFVTEVLTNITLIYALNEHPVREFELHELIGWEFDSTDFRNVSLYRLHLWNVWFYFPEFYFTTLWVQT
jgi:hypothetical protein